MGSGKCQVGNAARVYRWRFRLSRILRRERTLEDHHHIPAGSLAHVGVESRHEFPALFAEAIQSFAEFDRIDFSTEETAGLILVGVILPPHKRGTGASWSFPVGS